MEIKRFITENRGDFLSGQQDPTTQSFHGMKTLSKYRIYYCFAIITDNNYFSLM